MRERKIQICVLRLDPGPCQGCPSWAPETSRKGAETTRIGWSSIRRLESVRTSKRKRGQPAITGSEASVVGHQRPVTTKTLWVPAPSIRHQRRHPSALSSCLCLHPSLGPETPRATARLSAAPWTLHHSPLWKCPYETHPFYKYAILHGIEFTIYDMFR